MKTTIPKPVKSYFKKPKLTDAQKKQMCDEVRVRDRFCQRCGVWALISGHVHHKKTRGAHGDAAWRLDNMQLLCSRCHDKKHRGK